jgi:hypothetical protein
VESPDSFLETIKWMRASPLVDSLGKLREIKDFKESVIEKCHV